MSEVLRYAAFTTDPAGGNPAGVVLDATGYSTEQMQQIAAEVGFSETAFFTATNISGEVPHLTVRYFSPETEVDFCGHATIAASIAYARHHHSGDLLLETLAGPIGVSVVEGKDGPRATLTSVPTSVKELAPEALGEALRTLGWEPGDLDPSLPPRVAFGGVEHLVLAVATRERLAELDYDFEGLKALMLAEGWTTLQLVWRKSPNLFHARNPFPVGGVVEDPATGAAAAAFGGYLRALEVLSPPASFTIIQGEDMGRRSVLMVELSSEDTRIRVAGSACEIA